MTTSPTQTPNDKTVRLVDYLLRLATLRSTIIRDINEYEKVLWLSSIPHEQGCFTQAWGADEAHEPGEWIKVKNPEEPELPTRPAQCEDWVSQESLKNKDSTPELMPQIIRQSKNHDWREGSDQPETILRTEHIADHPAIQRAWERYVEEKWRPWAKLHDVWDKVHKIYSTLFAIHQEQLRLGEEYELVLGLGLLSWQTPTGQSVRRHLIVADAILEFEASLGQFTVRPHSEGAKIRPELDMLAIEDQPARAEATAKASLSTAEDDPWDKGCIEGVLKALVYSLNSQGIYDEPLELKTTRASSKPIVEYAPALILRKRTAKGLTETLTRLREQIEKGSDIPEAFADLSEVGANNTHKYGDDPASIPGGFAGEIFFPKPSNDEQRRIVEKIHTTSGVLVQGPPGTGKSHTIANLICHLLATGQRMLITAKTPRALQVLEELVPDELRPLCINLLGNGRAEQRSLESSVESIIGKKDEWQDERAQSECAKFEERLRKLREEKAQVDRRIRDIRESETYLQSIAEGTYRGTAARIAEAVTRDQPGFEWFVDSVPLEKNCPITADNFQKILKYLRIFTLEKRRELLLLWPENASLPSESFAALVKNETSAVDELEASTDGSDEQLADSLAKTESSAIAAIRDDLSTFLQHKKRLSVSPYSWVKDTVRDVLGGSSSLWRELLQATQNAVASIEKHVAAADDTILELPDTCDIRVLREDSIKLKEYMDSGGKLGWGIFRPRPVKELIYVIKSVKISGRPCSTAAHLSTLANVLYVRIELDKTWRLWSGHAGKTQGSYAMQLAAIKSLCQVLEHVLSLELIVRKCREVIQRCPIIGEPVWADESQVARIIQSCRLALASIRRRDTATAIQCVENSVASIANKSNTHPVTTGLLLAIHDRNINRFTRHINKIQELNKDRLLLQKLQESLNKLRRLLPRLVSLLEETCNEGYWDGRLQRIVDAWHWAQARYWIDNYIRQEDVPALATRAKQIEDEINNIIAKLASLHAWRFCFSRLTEDHRRHMVAWQQAMKLLGKGTGKYANRYRRQAQEQLNECREAVPAWVMPLHRVWDTVTPAPGIFDVIIVDEASQCGLEALPLLYLGKKIVIVGDDKQISPEAVGLDRNPINSLMEQFLYDFKFKNFFNIASSLFDHAKLRYGSSQITLREHFRCMPEIIRFSNNLCYSNTPLVPLRQYGPDRLPPLEHIFVKEGFRNGTGNRVTNPPEADAIVEKITELCSDNRYKNMSMGVVVLQGEAQAALIEGQLLAQLGAEEMERRRLICGNPYSFQGDERDIIFLSLVAAPPPESIGSLTKATDERRFNVAASRARDRMILFHSVTCNEIRNANCLRRKMLDFFEETSEPPIGIARDELERRAKQDNRSILRPPKPFDSWFEVDVALELLRKDFVILPQYEVAGRRIDLVVEGGQARLAIECDGDHWHGPDRYEDDMQRQRQLERCGWEFFRVRESAFYSNKVDALKRLWGLLEVRGIYPRSHIDISLSASTTEGTNKLTNGSAQKFDEVKRDDDIVEIGDTVLIRFIDGRDQSILRKLTLSEHQDAPNQGIVNIKKPLGEALLGAAAESEVAIVVDKVTRIAKIEKLIKKA